MLRSKKTKENVAQAQCPTKAYRSDEYRRRTRNYKNSEVLLKGIYIYIFHISYHVYVIRLNMHIYI